MARRWSRLTVLVGVGLMVAVPASAQVVQSLHFGVGGFFPRPVDTRDSQDVLLRNLLGETLPADPSLSDALIFEVKDFRSGRAFIEWNVGFGNHVEVGLGVGRQSRSVPTVYRDVVDDDFLDIAQTLHLRVVQLTAAVSFFPFGGPGNVQPYAGAGISALRFRYSEIGDFVDRDTLDIFAGRFVADGTAVGGVLLGGVRFPIGGDIYAFTLEGRYQFGVGDTGGADQGFLADKVDLGGGEFNVGFLVRF